MFLKHLAFITLTYLASLVKTFLPLVNFSTMLPLGNLCIASGGWSLGNAFLPSYLGPILPRIFRGSCNKKTWDLVWEVLNLYTAYHTVDISHPKFWQTVWHPFLHSYYTIIMFFWMIRELPWPWHIPSDCLNCLLYNMYKSLCLQDCISEGIFRTLIQKLSVKE